jgi:uncharacterized Zn finger protein
MSAQIPASMNYLCPECGEETLHKTLKGRRAGKKRLELVLKCSKCGMVRNEAMEAVRQADVRIIISRGEVSERTTARLPTDWEISVGEEFMHGDENLLVTGIEVKGAKKDSAKTSEIQTLWAKNFDRIRVKIAINRHGRTASTEIMADPDDEFTVEDEMEIDDVPVKIHSIKLKDRTIRRGSADARDIVRVYCTDSRPPRPPRNRGRVSRF